MLCEGDPCSAGEVIVQKRSCDWPRGVKVLPLQSEAGISKIAHLHLICFRNASLFVFFISKSVYEVHDHAETLPAEILLIC